MDWWFALQFRVGNVLPLCGKIFHTSLGQETMRSGTGYLPCHFLFFNSSSKRFKAA